MEEEMRRNKEAQEAMFRQQQQLLRQSEFAQSQMANRMRALEGELNALRSQTASTQQSAQQAMQVAAQAASQAAAAKEDAKPPSQAPHSNISSILARAKDARANISSESSMTESSAGRARIDVGDSVSSESVRDSQAKGAIKAKGRGRAIIG